MHCNIGIGFDALHFACRRHPWPRGRNPAPTWQGYPCSCRTLRTRLLCTIASYTYAARYVHINAQMGRNRNGGYTYVIPQYRTRGEASTLLILFGDKGSLCTYGREHQAGSCSHRSRSTERSEHHRDDVWMFDSQEEIAQAIKISAAAASDRWAVVGTRTKRR